MNTKFHKFFSRLNLQSSQGIFRVKYLIKIYLVIWVHKKIIELTSLGIEGEKNEFSGKIIRNKYVFNRVSLMRNNIVD